MAWTTPWAWFAGKIPTVTELTQMWDDIRWASGPKQSTPPGSPSDGDEWYLPDAVLSAMARLKYNAGSGSSYKWENTNAPLFNRVNGPDTTASTTYVAFGAAGPSITIPRAGDWLIFTGFRVDSATGTGQLFMSYDIGGTAAVDADACRAEPTSTSGRVNATHTLNLKVGLTAGVTLTAKGRVTAGTMGFADRYMLAIPIRVS